MLDFWRRLSFFGKVCGFVGAFTGAIVGAAAAWPIIEPFWYVTRGEYRLAMDRQALSIDRQTLFQLQEYLDRAQKDPGATTSPIVKQRIDDLKGQIEQMQARIRKAAGG